MPIIRKQQQIGQLSIQSFKVYQIYQFESLRWLIQKCLLNIIILMSNPNHIIIPIVKNKPTLEQLNVFQSSVLCLTPQKEAPFSKVLVDKKYSSAFKKYKQKKEKKDHNEQEPDHSLAIGASAKPNMPLKLKIRHLASLNINKNNQQLFDFSTGYDFYDPNQAPLYASDQIQAPALQKKHNNLPEKTERKQEEIQVQLQYKIKNEPMEQEMQVKYFEVNFRDDDPFIIVKKTNTKKAKSNRQESNSHKTKPIKKEKNIINNGEHAEKKITAALARQQKKIMPLFQQKDLLTLSLDSEKQRNLTFERYIPNEVNPTVIRKLKEGHEILSLQHILKDASVDESNKSDDQDVQNIESFFIARAGVMS